MLVFDTSWVPLQILLPHPYISNSGCRLITALYRGRFTALRTDLSLLVPSLKLQRSSRAESEVQVS